uniref:Uncharacterized protein n=1 Tax=Anguilla anguilla TaxID=7936 RepID=A0A0E9RC96_ANGAN
MWLSPPKQDRIIKVQSASEQ